MHPCNYITYCNVLLGLPFVKCWLGELLSTVCLCVSVCACVPELWDNSLSDQAFNSKPSVTLKGNWNDRLIQSPSNSIKPDPHNQTPTHTDTHTHSARTNARTYVSFSSWYSARLSSPSLLRRPSLSPSKSFSFCFLFLCVCGRDGL